VTACRRRRCSVTTQTKLAPASLRSAVRGAVTTPAAGLALAGAASSRKMMRTLVSGRSHSSAAGMPTSTLSVPFWRFTCG
jgi:hypothetical protein